MKRPVLVGVSLSREVLPPFARILLHTSLAQHAFSNYCFNQRLGMRQQAVHGMMLLSSLLRLLIYTQPSFCPATCSLESCCVIMRLPLSFLSCVILTFRMGLQGPLHVEEWDVSIHLKCRISGICKFWTRSHFRNQALCFIGKPMNAETGSNSQVSPSANAWRMSNCSTLIHSSFHIPVPLWRSGRSHRMTHPLPLTNDLGNRLNEVGNTYSGCWDTPHIL